MSSWHAGLVPSCVNVLRSSRSHTAHLTPLILIHSSHIAHLSPPSHTTHRILHLPHNISHTQTSHTTDLTHLIQHVTYTLIPHHSSLTTHLPPLISHHSALTTHLPPSSPSSPAIHFTPPISHTSHLAPLISHYAPDTTHITLDIQHGISHRSSHTIHLTSLKDGKLNMWGYPVLLTYLPHKAVAEVSKDKEPIGRECAEFNWSESRLMLDSSEVRFKWCGLSSDLRSKWFWLLIDLRFKWFGCQSMCASNDFGCLLFWTSSDVVVKWFEIQVIRLLIDLRFKNDFVVNRLKLFCEIPFKIEASKLQNDAFLRDFLQKWSFEAQKRSISARIPSNLKH